MGRHNFVMSVATALAFAGVPRVARAGETRGFAKGVTPGQAARNYASHSPSVPGVSVGPASATYHRDGSVTATRSASGPLGQHLTSTVKLTPARGGTSFHERTSGSTLAQAIHGAVYTPSKVAGVLTGNRK